MLETSTKIVCEFSKAFKNLQTKSKYHKLICSISGSCDISTRYEARKTCREAFRDLVNNETTERILRDFFIKKKSPEEFTEDELKSVCDIFFLDKDD